VVRTNGRKNVRVCIFSRLLTPFLAVPIFDFYISFFVFCDGFLLWGNADSFLLDEYEAYVLCYGEITSGRLITSYSVD
jgi:hypothetical protein